MVKLSWNPPKLPANLKAIHYYHADHASDVHEGAVYIRPDGGEVDMPSRPWIDWAIAETDFAETIATHFRIQGGESYDFAASLQTAFTMANEDFGFEMQAKLLSPEWHWPRETIRSDGSVVGSPRDIYDTGELYNSYELVMIGV